MCVCGCGWVWVINVGSKCISVWIGDGRGWQDNVMQPWYFSMSGSRHRQMVEKVRLCMLFCVPVWWGRGRIKQFSISISKLAKVCSSGKLYKQEKKKKVCHCAWEVGEAGGRSVSGTCSSTVAKSLARESVHVLQFVDGLVGEGLTLLCECRHWQTAPTMRQCTPATSTADQT